jgi:phage terminase large subunit-like protein
VTFLETFRDTLQANGMVGLGSDEIAARLNDKAVEALLALHEAELWEERFRKFENMFPEQYRKIGESEFFPRLLYPKHMEFFRVGAQWDERCAMCANRVGKTFGMGGYEATCHLTGKYPEWWEGRRFRHPVRGWAAGKTNETTRDIVQKVLLGEIAFEGARKRVDGSGLIPRELIGLGPGQLSWKQGVSDLVDTVKVRHVTGGWSVLGLKSYQQGRGSFEGTAQHFVWLDEEPPQDVYGECLMRTMTTKGVIMLTYTPLDGMSDVVTSFLPEHLRRLDD